MLYQHKMRLLSWASLDEAVFRLAAEFEGRAFNGVYGVPKSGTILATVLANYLELPTLDSPEECSIIVDSIYSTGSTLEKYKDIFGCSYAVWITRKKPYWYTAVEYTVKKEWVVFPWECPIYSAKERDSYYLRVIR